MKKLILMATLMLAGAQARAQQEELIKFGDFEQWITRSVKESVIVGGKTSTLYEVGPQGTWPQNKAYLNQGGSPWGTSNVYAKVMGVVKSNVGVFPDSHDGGKCVKLTTQYIKCKAVGIINISVIGAGSAFLGEMQEPLTSSNNPMSKMSAGIPFTKRPKAVKFDYKIQLSGEPDRIRETGFSKRKVIPGRDLCEAFLILQKRWEDSEGQIHAKRVGTMWKRFDKNTDWVNGATFEIHYGDITHTSYYRQHMELQNDTSSRVYYAKNSSGKMVKIIEEGWADANETPTHIVSFFNSSHGGAYIGSPGNTMWIDNVKLVY